MEWNIVFAHELEQLDIVRVFPPLFPIVSVVGGDRNVSEWCIKPNIEHLIVHAINWYMDTPAQISSHASCLQTRLDPTVANRDGIRCPLAVFRTLLMEIFDFLL